jgi:hypothetical protein
MKFHGFLIWALVVMGAALAACLAYAPVEVSELQQKPPGAEEAGTLQGPPTARPTLALTPLPALPESRRLTLDWPATMRTGDADIIRLILEVSSDGRVTPTVEFAGDEVTGEVVEIPNLYTTHHVLAEARLDIAGLQISPQGTVSEPLLPGERVSFYWSVRAAKSGNYQGTVWLHLRFLPKAGGAEVRQAISAQVVEIQVNSFLGLTAPMARWLGGLMVVLGAVINLPEISFWLIQWLGSQERARSAG